MHLQRYLPTSGTSGRPNTLQNSSGRGWAGRGAGQDAQRGHSWLVKVGRPRFRVRCVIRAARAGPRASKNASTVTWSRPGAAHQPAGVVIGHRGQIAVPFAMGDLVDPDPGHPVQEVCAAEGVGAQLDAHHASARRRGQPQGSCTWYHWAPASTVRQRPVVGPTRLRANPSSEVMNPTILQLPPGANATW